MLLEVTRKHGYFNIYYQRGMGMIETAIRADILNRIAHAEIEHDVRVVLAIESGSRAWGFASPNSDYDVRFLYVRRRDWYLSIDVDDRRDVIEYPIVDEIDINGWDIRKALQLFYKSNPALIEWLLSPITYIDRDGIREKMINLIPEIYAVHKGMYHYYHSAKTNYRAYLDAENVPLKKYFYALRPLLAIQWLQRYRQPAPIEFERLLSLVDDAALRTEIDSLLAQKKVSLEKAHIPQNILIDRFIRQELARYEDAYFEKQEVRGDISRLNELFLDILNRSAPA